MKKPKKYNVTGYVTIRVDIVLEAYSPEQAKSVVLEEMGYDPDAEVEVNLTVKAE